jgi:hypothetical protein
MTRGVQDAGRFGRGSVMDARWIMSSRTSTSATPVVKGGTRRRRIDKRQRRKGQAKAKGIDCRCRPESSGCHCPPSYAITPLSGKKPKNSNQQLSVLSSATLLSLSPLSCWYCIQYVSSKAADFMKLWKLPCHCTPVTSPPSSSVLTLPVLAAAAAALPFALCP